MLFLDELILWFATRMSDHEWVAREPPKVAKLVEAANANRPVPIVSFVARQPADLWRAFLADPATIERYHSKVYRRAGPGCWYWLSAISSTGHGRLRCGTRALEPERPGTRVVASHVYGFQLSRGLLRPDPATRLLPVIRHRCDEASCHRPSHWATGSTADNAADFAARGGVPGSPLTDRRGAAGRAIAIRGAILAGLDRVTARSGSR